MALSARSTHGGSRRGAGRPRVAPSGRTGPDVTPTDSKKRKYEEGRRREAEEEDDYRKADADFWTYLKQPTAVRSCLSRDEQRRLRGVITKVLKVHDKDHALAAAARDKGGVAGKPPCNGILDFPEGASSASTTGQRRYIINGSRLQGYKERAALPGDDSLGSSLFLAPATWGKVPGGTDALNLLTTRAGAFAKTLREFNDVHKVWVADPGYPKEVHELEVLLTPRKSPFQGPHQDTRFNILVVFDYVDDSLRVLEPATFSTFVADPARFEFRRAEYDDVKYIQIPRPRSLSTDGSVRWALANHAAWPHHGPGNTSTRARHVIMYTFALDEAASRHTTGESVYPSTLLASSSVVFEAK